MTKRSALVLAAVLALVSVLLVAIVTATLRSDSSSRAGPTTVATATTLATPPSGSATVPTGAASAPAGSVTAGRVLLVSYPRLRWSDVIASQAPNLSALLRVSTVASLSVNSASGHTGLGDGYATLGALNPMAAPEPQAGLAYNVDEAVGERQAGDIAGTGTNKATRGAVVHLDLSALVSRAKRARYGAVPGLLGLILHDSGRVGAVVANADLETDRGGEVHREAALAAMDELGHVDEGVVNRSLTMTDPTAPGGRRLDQAAVRAAALAAWSSSAFVLVEQSDLERVERAARSGWFRDSASEQQAWAGALAQADVLLGELLAMTTCRDTIMLVAPAAPGDASDLTVYAERRPGRAVGLAAGTSTRRAGLVTLPDVGSEVLDVLTTQAVGTGRSEASAVQGASIRGPAGGWVPSCKDTGAGPFAAGNTPVAPAGQTPLIDRLGKLVDDHDARQVRDHAAGPVGAVFGIGVLLVLLGALTVSGRVRVLTRLASPTTLVLTWLVPSVVAYPLVAYLAVWFRPDRVTPSSYALRIALGALVVGSLATILTSTVRRAVLIVLGITWLVVVVDLTLMDSRWVFGSAFGPASGPTERFVGLSLVTFAVLVVSSLVLAAADWERLVAVIGPRLRALRSGRLRPVPRPTAPGTGTAAYSAPALVVVASILAVTAVVIGLTRFGDDAAGFLAYLPAACLLFAVRLRAPVTAQRVVATLLGAVAAFLFAGLIDWQRPVADRGRLGRFVSHLGSGGWLRTVERKLLSNVALYHLGLWAVVVVTSYAVLVVSVLAARSWRDPATVPTVPDPAVRLGPGGEVDRWLRADHARHAAVSSIITAGAFGFLFNERGAYVVAAILGLLVPWLVAQILPQGSSAAGPVDADADAESASGSPSAPSPGAPDGSGGSGSGRETPADLVRRR